MVFFSLYIYNPEAPSRETAVKKQLIRKILLDFDFYDLFGHL